MPGPEFIVPTERIEDLQYHIQLFGERAEELEPILQHITDKILHRERRMFETHGASSGVYWAPLRRDTVKRKSGATSLSPLRRTDELMDSLSVRHARYQILNVDDQGIELSTSHPAAGFHASGTRRMPRRPPLIIPAKHAREYVNDINDFIFGEMNG